MHVELLVLPFVCTVLLVVLAPLPRLKGDVATLSFVVWLLVCNLIQGTNAVIWAGNSDERVPAWCDVATKLILGGMMALPASCLCITQRLEHAASTRPLHLGLNTPKFRVLFEASLCIIAPILFMLFHLVFQNHRFDIQQDYGCAASVYSSAITIVMWLPPLTCCIVSFILAGIAVHHSYRFSSTDFSQHVFARLSIGSSAFFRRLTITVILTALLFVLNLFSLFTSASNARISWSLMHADFHVIHVVKSADNPSIVSTWWGLRIISLAYVLLSVTLGEVRDIAKRILSKPSADASPSPWPLHRLKSSLPSTSVNPPSIPKPRPVSLDLKSGWDDMWEKRSPFHNLFSPSSSRAKSPIIPSSTSSRLSPRTAHRTSPTPSPTQTEDDAFLESTLTYLSSPAAYSLGLNAPIVPKLPVHSRPRKVPSKSAPAKQMPSPPTPQSHRLSGVSVISSVFDAHWPRPPESPSPPTSRTPSPSGDGVPSAHARADSVGTMAQSPSGLAEIDVLSTPPLPERPSLRTLRGQWNKNRLPAHGEISYGSSRQETV